MGEVSSRTVTVSTTGRMHCSRQAATWTSSKWNRRTHFVLASRRPRVVNMTSLRRLLALFLRARVPWCHLMTRSCTMILTSCKKKSTPLPPTRTTHQINSTAMRSTSTSNSSSSMTRRRRRMIKRRVCPVWISLSALGLKSHIAICHSSETRHSLQCKNRMAVRSLKSTN